DLGAAHLLRATLAVIPRQHQRNDESQRKRERDATAQTVWPRELLRNDIHALQQRERKRHVRKRPLHQLSLPEANEQSGRGFAHGIALAWVVVGNPTFLQNAAKRGSSL